MIRNDDLRPKSGAKMPAKSTPKNVTHKPHRVQLSRKAGARLPPNTVKVDRSTKWGNPFVVGQHGSRAECVDMFEKLMAGMVMVSHGPDPKVQRDYYDMVRRDRHQLRGKNLACWCPLTEKGQPVPCHADVLLRIKQPKAAE
jgi:hypothetical protein